MVDLPTLSPNQTGPSTSNLTKISDRFEAQLEFMRDSFLYSNAIKQRYFFADILSMKLSQVAFEEGTGKPTTLQTNELPAGLKWKKATMVLKTSKYSQITINLTRGPGAKGIAAISRILFRSSLPGEVVCRRYHSNPLYGFQKRPGKTVL